MSLETGVVFSALNGSSLQVAAPNVATSGWTNVAVINTAGASFDFTAGPHPFGAITAEQAGVIINEHYDLQGGDLGIGSGTRTDPQTGRQSKVSLAVWSGEQFAGRIVTIGATSDELIAVMSGLEFVELTTGLTIRPAQPDKVVFADSAMHALTMLLPIRDVGLLEVQQLAPNMVDSLPRFRGAKVRGGELFKELGELEQGTTMLLLAATAVARLYPNFSRTRLAEAADVLADIVLEWLPSIPAAAVSTP